MYLKNSYYSLTARCIALFCACFLLLTTVDLLAPQDEKKVFQNLIRLHVLANGDSDEEQRVKLLVRDAVIEECGSLFSGMTDSESALYTVNENIATVEQTANRVLSEQGATYTAKVVFGREQYPQRDYGDMSLPAGEYYSLRVLLGEAEGQNWWCVLFPPLCFGVSTGSFSDAGIDSGSSKVFTNKKYTFRFKLLEWFR